MDYSALLKKGLEKMPESVTHRERFEIPKVSGHIEGAKTVIKNMNEISQTLGRNVSHLTKFLLRELATPGQMRGSDFIFGRKLSPPAINEKVQKYADSFVFCPVCGKPDTELQKEGEITHLKCKACGNRQVVKTIL